LPLIGLVGVVLVSAFDRLGLYENAYGLTWLRVLAHVAIVDLGLVLACAVVALLRSRVAWLPTAAVAIATASVVWLHAWSPDARIASRNIADAAQGVRRLDVPTLASLSDDATPTLVAGSASLPHAERAALERVLACRAADHAAQTSTLTSWNRSWNDADEALRAASLPRCSAGP
jgi:two-component system sensor histidine kinase BaeS